MCVTHFTAMFVLLWWSAAEAEISLRLCLYSTKAAGVLWSEA